MLLLHLSDIHFRKFDVMTSQDPNFNLRNELLRDAKEFCQRLGPPSAIILSGDIAFAADPDEYKFATEWLARLCEECGTDLKAVFVCPGNHDVLRAIADRRLVQLIHRSIKSADEVAADALIQGYLADPESARLLYESLDNYNVFASQFFCDLLPPDRTRCYRSLKLNDGSTLRLWGINTSLVSSSADQPGDLFIDPACLQITRHDGVENLVTGHHHPIWIRQRQALEDHLNAVARVQIFGHVHTNRIQMDRDFIRLTASAAHPDRREHGWEPGYNLIELEVEGGADQRKLWIRTHVRVWQTGPNGFRAKMDKTRDVFEHRIELDRWIPQDAAARQGESSELPANPFEPLPLEDVVMTTLRDIGVRFYRLSFSKKSAIAGGLDLLEEQDMKQPDFERFRRVFLRAQERGKLEQLIAAIETAERG